MKTVLFAILALAGAVVLIATAGGAAANNGKGAGGVSDGTAFYVDGTPYRTVGTPTDFSNTGAPLHSYDIIYDFGGVQTNVAEAAPGDPDYNGGRWQVHAVSFSDYAGALADNSVDMNDNDVLDRAEEVEAAIAGGYATDLGVVKSFECPVIPFPHGNQ